MPNISQLFIQERGPAKTQYRIKLKKGTSATALVPSVIGGLGSIERTLETRMVIRFSIIYPSIVPRFVPRLFN